MNISRTLREYKKKNIENTAHSTKAVLYGTSFMAKICTSCL